jgi:hypothetical protein
MRHPPPLAIPAVLALTAFLLTDVRADNSPRAHDGGFLLRLSAGLGSGSTSIDVVGGDLEFSGLSGDGNLALGGVISPNLALHGTLWGWSVSDPDVELGGLQGELDGSIGVSAVGGGITYYLMPANVYLSASVGAAWLQLDTDFGDEGSDTGFALDGTVGKEWWVGNSWGLGIAGAVGYHSIPADGIDENFSGVSFGLRFTATLN